MSNRNPNPAPRPRPRVWSALLAAAVVVGAVLWVVGGCGKTSGSEAAPEIPNALIDTRDGQTYRTVKIGNQTWMAENLNYQTKRGSWCYGVLSCKHGCTSYCKQYGRLYDWNTAKTACPAGFHLPSRQEWNKLVLIAGGKDAAGKKLKAGSGWDNCGNKNNGSRQRRSLTHPALWSWNNCGNGNNSNGTDDFGFSALPYGGYLSPDGDFYNAGYYGYWWVATEDVGDFAYRRGIGEFNSVFESFENKSYAYSVRCVRDESASIDYEHEQEQGTQSERPANQIRWHFLQGITPHQY